MMGNSRKVFLFAAVVFAASSLFAQASRPDALKLYREGKYKESIEVCEAEIAARPENMDSYAVLCWALVANKQYAEAEQRATQARKINAADIRIMEILGEAKYYLGKNNEALAMFQRYVSNASETAGRLGTAYFYMGEIYVRQSKFEHDWKSAIVAYDKALAMNPSQYDATRGKTRCQSHL